MYKSQLSVELRLKFLQLLFQNTSKKLFPNKMLCVIWYHLFNPKNVKNTHGVLLFAQLKLTFLYERFPCFFLQCTNGTISRKASHISWILLEVCFPTAPGNFIGKSLTQFNSLRLTKFTRKRVQITIYIE